jgi:hypothetical protein
MTWRVFVRGGTGKIRASRPDGTWVDLGEVQNVQIRFADPELQFFHFKVAASMGRGALLCKTCQAKFPLSTELRNRFRRYRLAEVLRRNDVLPRPNATYRRSSVTDKKPESSGIQPVLKETPAESIAAENPDHLAIWKSRLQSSVEDLEASKRQLEALTAQWPASMRERFGLTREQVRVTHRETEQLISALRLVHSQVTA